MKKKHPKPIPMRQCRRCSHWSSRIGCTLLDLEPCRPVLRSWLRSIIMNIKHQH